MAEYAVAGKDLKKLIGAARKKPLPFAYNPGKGDDEDYFALHRKRSGGVMAKVAKKEGAGSKAAFGTCKVDGSVIWLTCEEVVPSIGKRLKKFLKANKVSLSVKITDLAGNVLEEEIEENPVIEAVEDDDEEEGAEAEEALDAQAIIARIKAAQPRIAAAPPAIAGKLVPVLKQAATAAKAGDLDTAQTAIGKIEAVLDKLPPAAAPGEDPAPATQGTESPNPSAELVARIKTLQPRLGGVPPAAAKQLQTALTAVVGQIKAQKFDVASGALDKIEAALAKLEGQAAQQPQTDGPEPPAADPRTAKLQDAARTIRAKVEALPAGDTSDALLRQLADIDASIAAGEVEEGVTGLKNIQTSLTLQAEVDRLAPAFAEAMSSGKVSDPNKLSILFNTAAELVPGPDHAKAQNALKAAQEMIAQGADGASAHAEGIDPAVQPFATSRIRWRDARVLLTQEMDRLKASILEHCKGHESLEEVPGKADMLFDYIKGLDSRLEDKLDEVVNAAPGAERDQRKAEAVAMLEEYQNELKSPFFAAVDGNNGFTNVAIAATAEAALQDIANAIAA